MSIATELSRIQSAKTDIRTAIEAKGVTVPSSALIDTYDDYIAQIPTGGGGNYDVAVSYTSDTIPTSAFTSNLFSSAEISSGITSIGGYAFAGCRSLSSITIPDSVTSIEQAAFSGCTSLTEVYIGSGVTEISGTCFRDCRNVTSFTFSENSSLEKIGGSGSTANTGNVRVMSNINSTADPAILEIDFPEGLVLVGHTAFVTSSGIKRLSFPSTLTWIGDQAFRGLTGCESITFKSTTPPTLGGSGRWFESTTCPIYVPAASVDTYKAASNWSNYASQIQAIPS
jgi:hypothetical protein